MGTKCGPRSLNPQSMGMDHHSCRSVQDSCSGAAQHGIKEAEDPQFSCARDGYGIDHRPLYLGSRIFAFEALTPAPIAAYIEQLDSSSWSKLQTLARR